MRRAISISDHSQIAPFHIGCRSDYVIGVMDLLHSFGFGSVLPLQSRIINCTEIIGLCVDGCGRVANISEGRKRTFFPVISLTIRSSVGEND